MSQATFKCQEGAYFTRICINPHDNAVASKLHFLSCTLKRVSSERYHISMTLNTIIQKNVFITMVNLMESGISKKVTVFV